MEDKLVKVKAEIERLKKEALYKFPNVNWLKGVNFSLTRLEVFIDSMQEEPTTSVWHDTKEEPSEDKQVLIYIGKFCYVVFYHKKDKCFYMFYNSRHYLHEIDKWAYTDDLLKH